MFHLSAFRQNVDLAAGFSAINAVREEQLFTNGPDLRIPTALPGLLGEAALIGNITPLRAQLQSPSLRVRANLDIEPIVGALVFGSPPENLLHPDTFIPLVPDEALNLFLQATGGGATENAGLVFLGDGPLQPVTGEMFSIRATATVQQVVTGWVNGNLTLSQVLPAGRFQVVGLRARSADAIAARLVFSEQVARPGVPAVNALADLDPWAFRFGRIGVWGEFSNTLPPTVDVFGGVAAVQTFILDLLRVA
jgi:hypothetical protein